MTVHRLVHRFAIDAAPVGPAPGVAVARACPRGDAAALGQVVEAVRAAGFPVTNAAGLVADLASRPGRGVDVWLARVEGEPAGLAAAVTAGREPAARHSLAWLLVSPALRRRGVGTALVAAVLDAARARGAEDVWLETHGDWTAAAAFWQAVGFRLPR